MAEEVGLRRATVSGWLAQARAGHGVNEATRRRPRGQGRTLTPAQEQRLRPDIGDLTPAQRKRSLARWNAQAVPALIPGYLAMALPVRSVRNAFKRWGFTSQRPLKRAGEHKPEAVQPWLPAEYPTIAGRAQGEGAHLCWGDEAAGSWLEPYPRGYAPKGQPPVLVLSRSKRARSNLMSALPHQGTLRFRRYRHTLSAKVLSKFLERLIPEADQQVFWSLDHRRVHHSVKVQHGRADKRERLELFCLPR